MMSKLFWERLLWVWLLGFPLAFGSGVSSVSNYNPSAVAITGGTITGAGTTINIGGSITSAGGYLTTGTGGYKLGSTLLFSPTAPTIASGFGTGATITRNGTAAIWVNVGTGAVATNGTIAMNSVAPNKWTCSVGVNTEVTGTLSTLAAMSDTTTVTFYSVTTSTGAATAWPSGAQFTAICIPI